MWPRLTNTKALKLRLGFGLVLKRLSLQKLKKPVLQPKSKLLVLFYCNNIQFC